MFLTFFASSKKFRIVQFRLSEISQKSQVESLEALRLEQLVGRWFDIRQQA